MKYEELQKLAAWEKVALFTKLTGTNYMSGGNSYPPNRPGNFNFELQKSLKSISPTSKQKVDFCNALHARLSINAPKNKVKQAMVSIYDYVAATEEEQADAFLMAFA
jgi:hypothetical protein